MPDYAKSSTAKVTWKNPHSLQTSEVEVPRSMTMRLGQSTPGATRADIVAVGGAEDKENEKQILWDFLQRAGGSQAILAIIPAASGIPDVLGNLYRNLFVDMGADSDQVRILDIRNPADARHPEALELVKRCTGIYFTGGDQERLSEVLTNTELMELIRQRCGQGQTVIAGTSAGASALGQHMISRGYSGESPTPAIVTVKTGLGILPTLIVDQHFHQRNRLVRLITAVTYHPHCLGLGIDEDTAAIIHADNTLDVIGTGSVTLVDGSHIQSDLQETPSDQNYYLLNARIHFLSPGSRFHLDTMKLL